MSQDPAWMSATQLAGAFRSKELSPVEVLRAITARIDRVNPVLNAIISLDEEGALREAEAAQKAYESGKASPLAGVPLTIKDNTATSGMRTTSGSLVFQDWVPTRDTPLVRRLRDAGACIFARWRVRA